MLRVMRNHRRAAHGETHRLREGLAAAGAARPYASAARQADIGRARQARLGQGARRSARQHGYRNAQATVMAPTGTIGLVMDCDTTGIEPDFALVKFKKLAGGGYWKIINRAVPAALRTLGYRESEIAEIEAYAVGHGSLSQRARHQPLDAEGQGLHRRSAGQGREGAADRVRHQVRLQQVDAGRGLPARHARRRGRGDRRAELRPARRARLHQARDRSRQHPRLRRDDGGRRAAPQGRALRGVRLRQSLRQASASAISRSRATSA